LLSPFPLSSLNDPALLRPSAKSVQKTLLVSPPPPFFPSIPNVGLPRHRYLWDPSRAFTPTPAVGTLKYPPPSPPPPQQHFPPLRIQSSWFKLLRYPFFSVSVKDLCLSSPRGECLYCPPPAVFCRISLLESRLLFL